MGTPARAELARMVRATSSPLLPGTMMSRITNAGRRACISSRNPVLVGNQDTPYPAGRRWCFNRPAISGSSSRMKMVGLSGWGAAISAPCHALSRAVSYVRTAHPEYDVFGDIGGMVRYTFQIAGNGQGVQRLHCAVRFCLHEDGKTGERLFVDSVDIVVAFKHMPCQFRVAFNE